jgi:hypothetical protein
MGSLCLISLVGVIALLVIFILVVIMWFLIEIRGHALGPIGSMLWYYYVIFRQELRKRFGSAIKEEIKPMSISQYLATLVK